MQFYIKIFILYLVLMLISKSSFCQYRVDGESYYKQNLIDKNGKKQGFWREVYKTDFHGIHFIESYICEGYYYNDFKDGEWLYYDKNGFLSYKEYYYNDTTYLQTKFYSNNQIKSTGVIEIKVTNDFDTIIVTDPLNGNQSEEIRRLLNYVHIENWKYYHKDGTEAKKEEFDENGELIEKK